MCVYIHILCCLIAKLYLILCDSMDCSPPGSSVHGISQSRILEWVAISFSNTCAYLCEIKDSSNTRNENEELGLFCYYKLLTLPLKWYSVI